MNGREYPLRHQHGILALSCPAIEAATALFEGFPYPRFVHVEQVHRHRQRLFQRREWTGRRVYYPKLLRPQYGPRRFVLRHHALSIVGYRLRTSVRQNETMGAKRLG